MYILFQDCPENICLPINVRLCEENFSNCEIVPLNSSRLEHSCRFSLYSGEQVCHRVVKQLKYIFHHNGTEGFTKIELYLILINITFYITENEQFEQNFEIKFRWFEHEKNLTLIKSGNPGYIIGKPILIAHVNLSTLNASTEELFEFIINQNVYDNFLSVPENENGYCNNYKVVEFDYNTRLNCKKTILLKSKNETNKICHDIQSQVFDVWHLSGNNSGYVAVFGNSNRRKTEEWIKILYDFKFNETFENITTNINDNKIICTNLINILKINVLYAYVDFENIKNQRKILNVFYELKIRDYFEFDSDQMSVDFKVSTEVMFYDITSPKIRKFVGPPSLQLKLPDDFFYPFMYGKATLLYHSTLFLCVLHIFL